MICSYMCKHLNRHTCAIIECRDQEKPQHLCSMWLQITVLEIKAAPEGIADASQLLSLSQRLTDMRTADQAVQLCVTMEHCSDRQLSHYKPYYYISYAICYNVSTFHNSSSESCIHAWGCKTVVVEPPSYISME